MKPENVISLDGTLKSHLDWTRDRDLAREYIQQGRQIFWDIDLGISSGLILSHASHFLSLKLSLEHFNEILWTEFSQHTAGICIYRGSVNFTETLVWNAEQEGELQQWLQRHFATIAELNLEIASSFSNFDAVTSQGLSATFSGTQILQLFSRDTVSHYLDLLANYLPSEGKSYIVLDTSTISDPVHLANLISKEHFPQLRLKDNDLLESTVAVCIPSIKLFKPSQYGAFRKIFADLAEKNTPYRVIPETRLTLDWEGLDQLIVSSEHVSHQCDRMLKGFSAAGGDVVYVP